MPIYEYQCPKCGSFERMQKFSDPPVKRCPTCKSKVTKLISNTSFQLKGSGWYLTDYARKNGSGGAGGAKSESAEKAETTSSEASSGGSKSDSSKSEPKTKTNSKHASAA
jgi:putative FmdB family regulatory protein